LGALQPAQFQGYPAATAAARNVHRRQVELVEQFGDGDGQVVRGAADALGLAG
jgi:hypothetical protein